MSIGGFASGVVRWGSVVGFGPGGSEPLIASCRTSSVVIIIWKFTVEVDYMDCYCLVSF